MSVGLAYRGPNLSVRPLRWVAESIAGNTRTLACGNAPGDWQTRATHCGGVTAGVPVSTMSRCKHPMGVAKLRVRGMAKMTYVSILRALGLNIHRVAAYRAAAG